MSATGDPAIIGKNGHLKPNGLFCTKHVAMESPNRSDPQLKWDMEHMDLPAKQIRDFILEDTHKIAKSNAYTLQLEDFCRVVRGTATPLVPLHDSIVNAMTTEALVASLKQGQAVDVEPVDP
jgi:hypothetical protein